MRAAIFVAAIALASSCSVKSKQHVEWAHLEFDVPGDWTHHEKIFKGVATSVWTPFEGNDGKESLTIIRTELVPNTAHATEAQIADLLRRAQNFGKATTPIAVNLPSGLSGARVEVDYVPPGLHDKYRRIHVVLIDGASLVHVMYTAKTIDAQFTTLNFVLGSLREGEG